MYFNRYEIRWIYEDGDWDYIPFDSLSEAEKYIEEHKCSSDSSIGMTCKLYKVKIFSNYDSAELIRRL